MKFSHIWGKMGFLVIHEIIGDKFDTLNAYQKAKESRRSSNHDGSKKAQKRYF